MSKETKLLYETSVKKQVEEPVIEKKTENGETIEIKRTKKTAKSIKVAILKPDRKLIRGAEMFYAKSLSQYLKDGLLPYSLVAKRYANDGGPLTDKETKRLDELKKEGQELQAQFYAISPEDKNATDKRSEILIKINDINTEAASIQNAYTDIFDSTADMKARNDTIEWWVVYLSLIDSDKGYVSFYKGETYEDKILTLEEYENRSDAFELEVMKKLSYLISFWFTARNTITKFDFEAMDKLYQDKMTEYTVEENQEDVKITDLTEPKLEPKPEAK